MSNNSTKINNRNDALYCVRDNNDTEEERAIQKKTELTVNRFKSIS